MNEIVFEILKVIVMLAVLLLTRYIVPWIKARIGAERLEEVKQWVNSAVLAAQQVYEAKTGEQRKEIVIGIMREMLFQKNIEISEDQLDMLIEAAVKSMKMQEGR